MNSVVVVGAATGVGRFVAIEAGRRGIEHLRVVDRDTDALTQLKSELDGPRVVRSEGFDLVDPVALAGFADHLAQEPPDLLINCAGVREVAPIQDTTDEIWHATISVNLTAAFMLTRAAARAMIASGTQGVIVNVASVASEVGFSDRAAYCASKAGVLGLTRAAAIDLGPYGIRVVCISPGVHNTGMAVQANNDDQFSTIPMRRPGDPADLARISRGPRSSRAST